MSTPTGILPGLGEHLTAVRAASVSGVSQTVAAEQLRAFIERIERLESEIASMREDVKEVYAEAKGTGFDTKAVRAIIKLRKMDAAERQEQEAVIDLYKAALGMA